VRIQFLLGPAGSGKTFRCLEEIRRALLGAPKGAPLLLLAPKQSTYQLERQLLAFSSLSGYTRLQILSFERLAHFAFDLAGKAEPEMLDEEGRLMVLRGLLARKRDSLKLFRASARLTGFAQQLSLLLRELQRNQVTPDTLQGLAGQLPQAGGLAFKLQDLATLLREYLQWLEERQLHDADSLLPSAAAALRAVQPAAALPHPWAPSLQGIKQVWVDGFAEFSMQELDLLDALIPLCEQVTLSFCLDRVPEGQSSWLSTWSVVRKSFQECHRRWANLPGGGLSLQGLDRDPDRTRFTPVLQHLERSWDQPDAAAFHPSGRPPFAIAHEVAPPSIDGRAEVPLSQERGRSEGEFRVGVDAKPRRVEGGIVAPVHAATNASSALRLALCPDPEAEATLAARELLRHIRQGGRWREAAVLVRNLELYHLPLQRVFARYDIPFFLDRRESVSHHPLAELTRSALRTVAFQWQGEDWFAALKTGLAPATEAEIDRLENEALARGWRGESWKNAMVVKGDPALTEWLGDLCPRLLPPFQKLALAMKRCASKPTGAQLAAAIRELWLALKVETRLRQWAESHHADARLRLPASVHATVWAQMNGWLDNVELAFPAEALPLREWLPILEAGLANLTVGVIPPALDQVLIGALDRSRNPEPKLALVLGMNEGQFPAPVPAHVLLTEQDRLELERHQVVLGSTARDHLSRERFHAYVALTRARQRLVLTCARQDAQGSPLNPSPFLAQVRGIFPGLELEVVSGLSDWRESEHVCELVAPLLRLLQEYNPGQVPASLPSALLERLPAVGDLSSVVRQFRSPDPEEALAPELGARLYGPVLHTSVSRIEQFAACPFKFFVHSGLRAEERKTFELDAREQGSFQHDVLALFHEQLREEHKRWRDITPAEARERIRRIADALVASYRDGLLQASEQTRFMARVLTQSLQDFAETLVDWMWRQYQFEPVAVELPFGEEQGAPPWSVDLGGGHALHLHGRIDRVDLFRQPGSDQAWCVVVDYKSSQKQLEPLLLAHGLQLQLLGYLNVLLRLPQPEAILGVPRLRPAGVFYVNLRGRYASESNRQAALAEPELARKLAYRHTGRFDLNALPWLDSRPQAAEGDQFNYRRTKDGRLNRNCREALSADQFAALLASVEAHLKTMGTAIYAGVARVDPYRKGASTACQQCAYQAICRIDPWTHRFRLLRPLES
jgi:ATP-dependent helicase/nuclease subunit B